MSKTIYRGRYPDDTVVSRGVAVYSHPITGTEIRQKFCFYDTPDLQQTTHYVAHYGIESNLNYCGIEWDSVRPLFDENDGTQLFFTVH